MPYTFSLANIRIGTQQILVIQMFIKLLLCQPSYSVAELNQIYWSLSQLVTREQMVTHVQGMLLYMCLFFPPEEILCIQLTEAQTE